MDTLLQSFRQYLFTSKTTASRYTVKNYLADIRHFLTWYENEFAKPFDPTLATSFIIDLYKKAYVNQKQGNSSLSYRSFERHLSSLRKFFVYLATTGQITANPMDDSHKTEKQAVDEWHIQGFKDYLYQSKIANISIKNYIIDIQQFITWMTRVAENHTSWHVADNNPFTHISSEVIEEYKDRLLNQAGFSPVSVNRKLSALRRYLSFAQDKGLLKQEIIIRQAQVTAAGWLKELDKPLDEANLIVSNKEMLLENRFETTESVALAGVSYSPFGPFRLIQKLMRFHKLGITSGMMALDLLLTGPLAFLILKTQHLAWSVTGREVFLDRQNAGNSATNSRLATLVLGKISSSNQGQKTNNQAHVVRNFSKSFYAPLAISVTSLPFHQQIYHHIRHTRPKWYRRYHTYAFVHYMHFAVMMVFMTGVGFLTYHNFTNDAYGKTSMATPTGPPRLLSFEGKIADFTQKPYAAAIPLRFSLYNDQVASGEALLWQEARTITPDQDGEFSVILGNEEPLPDSAFARGDPIFLGITPGTEAEFHPRQQIATTALAENAESLQGMRPITDPISGIKNALLALDSTGNLVIGGAASPTFQATGGQFTLSGEGLLLTTNAGSNADVLIAPDSFGKIDLQKPLQNTSNNTNIESALGAVEVQDLFAILATSSGQSAFTINQNDTGPLISASTSGIAKFTVDNDGAGVFASNLAVLGENLTTTQTSFNLLDSNVVNLQIGRSATSISLGARSGKTTMNSQTVDLIGNLSVAGAKGIQLFNQDSGITFSGFGNHTIAASQGALMIGAATMIGDLRLAENTNILPSGTTGLNNLGSENNPFDNLYVQNIISPSLNGISGFWQLQNGTLSPTYNTNDILIGGTSSSSAAWQVYGSGQNVGTASSSGNLSFRGPETAINQLNGGSLNFQTSAGGDDGLTSRLYINSVGNIGIGLTSPVYSLQLGSDSAAKPVSNTWTIASDSRLKENIYSFNDGLSVLRQINPVSYTLNGKAGLPYGAKGIGILAQDVKDIIPYTIDTFKAKLNPDDPKETELFSFNSSALTFVTINALKELDTRLTAAEQEQQALGAATHTILADRTHDILLAGSTPETYTIIMPDGTSNNHILAFAEGIAARFTAGAITTHDLFVEGSVQVTEGVRMLSLMAHDITATTITATEQLYAAIIETDVLQVTQQLTAPLASIVGIETSVISPLSIDSNIALSFEKDQLTIRNGKNATSSAVATFDNQGNATLNGTLTSQGLSTADASISGTLRAGKIIASDIEGLEAKIGTLSATTIINNTNVYQSASSSSDLESTTSNTSTTGITGNNLSSRDTRGTLDTRDTFSTDFMDIASISSQLAYVPSLNTDFATVNQGLMAFGPASFADVSIASQLAVGGNLIITNSSIDVVGNDLALQPLRQGGITMLGGLFTLDIDGNIQARGDATFARNVTVKGTLAANLISPVADSDLIVQLGKLNQGSTVNDQTDSARKPEFIIHNSSGSGVLTIDQQGSLLASGSGIFRDLIANGFHVVRGAQADNSLTETIASSSAGTAIILPGQTERTIITPYVKTKSLIYLSPTSDTQSVIPYIARQTTEDLRLKTKGSFTIQIPTRVSKGITVNWWIIN